MFVSDPPADDLLSLVKTVASKHTKPKHFISDRGIQFTAGIFRKTLSQFGIAQRFGAVGKTGSIALIERLWRTVKDLLALTLLRPILQHDLERRLELVLYYYAYLRPHQGLGGATPAEIYFRSTPAHLAAVSPPRAPPREDPTTCPFKIAFFDPERRLPYLVPAA